MAVTEIVLLVEDEPLILLSVAELLSSEGFEVLSASSSDEAAATLEARPETSVVVTDINLGDGNSGIDLAWKLARSMPHVRVILISGQERPARDQYPAEAIFLTKPYAPGALISLTRRNPDLVQA
jgi:DNA-binding NtrC family response regulator